MTNEASGLSSRNHESVERVIPAPADKIFDLLADPARHAEIDGSGTVVKATGESQRLSKGAKFGMSMKKGVPYSMENTVVEFEENRLIAWQPRPPMPPFSWMIGGRIWRYELEPVEGGTRVRETWDISQERVPAFVRPLRKQTREAMAATLERIEQVLTSDG